MDTICKIQKLLSEYQLDAVLITEPSNRRYVTGFASTAGVAVICKNDAVFYVDSRYIEAASAQVQFMQVFPISTNENLFKQVNQFITKNEIRRLGFEEQEMSVSKYQQYKEKIAAEFCDASTMLAQARIVKSRTELQNIIAAQRIAEKSLSETLSALQLNMTEKELAAELLYRMLRNGAEDKSFDTIVVSGNRSSMPHGEPTDQKLQKGFLTIDFGAKYKGYCSDMTRTVCIGTPTEEMRQVYETVLTAQTAGIAAAAAAKSCAEIDGAARNVIEKAGYGKRFGHAFGHGIGIDIHEKPTVAPRSNDLLLVGSVISAEPGIYIPGKFGVRIEDVLYITDNGCENITDFEKSLMIF